MPMELFHIGIAYAIILVGAACQSSIGMGFALITVPILLLLDPAFVPISIICSGFVLSLLIMRRDRTALDLSGIGIALAGRFTGTALAAALLLALPRETLIPVIGGLIVLGVLVSLLHTSTWTLTPVTVFGAGVVSGIMGTLAGVGGLPMGLLYQHQQGAIIRSTLAGFFAVGGVVSLVSLWLVGQFSLHELRLFGLVLPALLLGFALSRVGIRYLDQGYTRAAILWVSALSGVTVIIKSLVL